MTALSPALPPELHVLCTSLRVPPDFDEADRPYVAINMVQSVDGRATLDGRAGPLGDEVDQALLETLRARSDAVLVGAGTVRTEGYGELLTDPGLRQGRIQRGLPARPIACVVSGKLALDPGLPLLANPELEVCVVTGAEGRVEGAAASVRHLRASADGVGDRISLGPALTRLRAEAGVRLVVCEGGPTLNASLFREGLVDEVFLTQSPRIVGGPAPLAIVAAEAIGSPVGLELVTVVTHADFAFFRYKVAR